MMENVHLAPEGENEDLYSGYDYNEPLLEVRVLAPRTRELAIPRILLPFNAVL